MNALPYLLPWFLLILTIGIAVAVKLLPLKSIAGASVSAVILLIIIGLSVYSNIVTHQLFGRVAEKQQKLEDMEQWKYRHLDELSLLIAQLREPSDKDVALVQRLESYGWTSDDPALIKMRDAHDALERLKADYTPSQPMLIKGIPLTVSNDIVSLQLRTLGFTVLPYRADEKPEPQSNIIYYGRDMKPIEVKLAALSLMQAGVDLKGVKPFPQPTQGNLRAIKIDWNKYYEARKGMTVQEVEAGDDFN